MKLVGPQHDEGLTSAWTFIQSERGYLFEYAQLLVEKAGPTTVFVPRTTDSLRSETAKNKLL